jgi:hypothetical protein
MDNPTPILPDIEVRVYSENRVQLALNQRQRQQIVPIISYHTDSRSWTTWCYEKETDIAVMCGAPAEEIPEKFDVVKMQIQTESGESGDNSGNISVSGELPAAILDPIKEADAVKLWPVTASESEWGIGYAYVYPAGSFKNPE